MSNSSSIFRNQHNQPPLQGLVVGPQSKVKSTKDREAVVTLGGLLLLFILGWVGAALPLVHQAHRSLSGTPFLYHDDPGRLQSQSSNSDLQGGADDRMPYYDDDVIPEGVLSEKRQSFFRAIQEEIDNQDFEARCQRYGFLQQPPNDDLVNPNETQSAVMLEMLQKHASIPISVPKTPRRIFYGSLLADEPHELLEIIAAETFGIFAGMVFVESNRTQTGHKRKFTRKPKHIQKFKELFGTPQIQFRRYVNEEDKLFFMAREHRQRHEILKGWREMGMKPDDIGYITDADETFTRDFLRAVQSCPVEALDYERHHCFNPKVKIAGFTRIFESSPECGVKNRDWYHPDMIVGACIELIGNETANPPAPRRQDYLRANGYADNCETLNEKTYNHSFGNIHGNKYPLWSAADFRRQCGGHQYKLLNTHTATSADANTNATTTSNHQGPHTAYHFHNFFANLKATRRKYKTYGHPIDNAMTKRLENIGDDLKLLVRCVKNWTDAPTSNHGNPGIFETQQWQRDAGGLAAMDKPWPIYFMDPEYRLNKHEEIQELVRLDEQRRWKHLKLKPHEQEIERLRDESQELRRQMWVKDAQIQKVKDRYQSETGMASEKGS